MEYEDILAELSKSDRWGTNCQPELEEFADFLARVDEEVGLADLAVLDRDEVYFRTLEPLTLRLAFELGRLMFDGLPEELENEQVQFRLWWA